MDSIRQQKISSLLKKELALIFQREGNTTFNGRFITVTMVRISPDMGVAKVYLSVMASKDKDADLRFIRSHASHVRKILGNQIGKQVRKIPELAFFIDDSLDYYDEIDQLLKK